MPDRFHWLIATDTGLMTRVLIGVVIFAVFAIYDFRLHGRAATRWKEYAILAICVIAAMAYGIVNDQITCSFSWEFFYYGKGLEHVLGPDLPPDPAALHWEAAKVAMKATWAAGLILGVLLLLANNPRRDIPRLKFRELLKWLPIILGITAILAVIGGFAGYMGWLNGFGQDFQEMWQANVFRPRRFMAAWGANLGAYAGGVVGTFIAVIRIFVERRKQYRAIKDESFAMRVSPDEI